MYLVHRIFSCLRWEPETSRIREGNVDIQCIIIKAAELANCDMRRPYGSDCKDSHLVVLHTDACYVGTAVSEEPAELRQSLSEKSVDVCQITRHHIPEHFCSKLCLRCFFLLVFFLPLSKQEISSHFTLLRVTFSRFIWWYLCHT